MDWPPRGVKRLRFDSTVVPRISPYQRYRGCERKKAFDTEEAAARALEHLVQNGKAVMDEMNVYHCEFCSKYHVGHREVQELKTS